MMNYNKRENGKEINFTVPIHQTFRVRNKKTRRMQNKKRMIGLNWYRTVFFAVNNNVKKKYLGYVLDSIGTTTEHLKGRLRVEYKIYLSRNGSDGGNVRSVIEKYILDAVKFSGYIKDDQFRIITGTTDEYFYDKENPRCEIRIFEI